MGFNTSVFFRFGVLDLDTCYSRDFYDFLLMDEDNAVVECEMTPLMLCAYDCNIECVKLLLKLGADPDVKTKDKGWTAIAIAEKLGDHEVTLGQIYNFEIFDWKILIIKPHL